MFGCVCGVLVLILLVLCSFLGASINLLPAAVNSILGLPHQPNNLKLMRSESASSTPKYAHTASAQEDAAADATVARPHRIQEANPAEYTEMVHRHSGPGDVVADFCTGTASLALACARCSLFFVVYL